MKSCQGKKKEWQKGDNAGNLHHLVCILILATAVWIWNIWSCAFWNSNFLGPQPSKAERSNACRNQQPVTGWGGRLWRTGCFDQPATLRPERIAKTIAREKVECQRHGFFTQYWASWYRFNVIGMRNQCALLYIDMFKVKENLWFEWVEPTTRWNRGHSWNCDWASMESNTPSAILL